LEVPLPLVYRGFKLDCGYRVEHVTPIHEAQLLTYLGMGAWKAGLLLNFNVLVLRDGILRRVLGLDEERD
jgi:hypothetical protein